MTDITTNSEALFTDAQLAVLVDVAFSLSVVSLIGSLFICLSTALFPKLRTFAFKLILGLAVANIGLDIAYLLGDPEGASTALCYAQGLMRVYFALVGFFLTTAITVTCYFMVVRQDFTITERLWRIMAVCWGVPLPMVLLPLTTASYGDAGAWCSIVAEDGELAGIIWRFAIIYVPLWAAVGANLWMHLAVSRAIHRLEAAAAASGSPTSSERTGLIRGGQSRTLAVITRLRMYPVVLCVCWSWASVNRVYELVAPDSPVFWLYLLQYTFQTLNGVLNATVYAITPSVDEEWTLQLQRWTQSCCGGGAGTSAKRRSSSASAAPVEDPQPAPAAGGLKPE